MTFKLPNSLRLSDRWFDALVIAALLATGIVWTALSGKDLNWDQFNYHFYLGYGLFENRISKDFMPASGQSYLNPLAYAPFYWMVMHHWNSLLIASLLSIGASLTAVIGYFLVKTTLPANITHVRLLACAAAILTLLSPVLLAEIGTTFADAPTATLVLTAVLCGLHSNRELPWWRDWAVIAGLLMGAAGALKLSNLVFGPACALLIALMQPTWLRRVRSIALLGIGFTIGMILLQGYWGLQLWKEFGNPFLPYFSNVFHTDIFPKEGASPERFLPRSALDVLLVPFRMVLLRSWIYIENVAPDLRFAILVLVTAFGSVYLVASKRLSIAKAAFPRRQKIVALSAYFVTAFGLWQWTSGNGRYGLVVALLCGPMLVLMTYFVCAGKNVANYLLGAIIVAQIFHLQNGDLRWSKGPWTSSWYNASIPDNLRKTPYLYIAVGKSSNSFIFPFLSLQSAFTNPIGQISFELEGYNGARLRQLFANYRGRVRVIALTPSLDSNADAIASWIPGIDSLIARLGFAIDESDCQMITSADGSTEVGAPLTIKSDRLTRLISCHLVEKPYAFAQERARMTKIAEQVVSWCPKLFKPAHTALEQTEAGWSASYPSTDSSLMIKDGELLGIFFHSSATLGFGTVEQWEKGIRPSCASFPAKPRDVYNFY